MRITWTLTPLGRALSYFFLVTPHFIQKVHNACQSGNMTLKTLGMVNLKITYYSILVLLEHNLNQTCASL